MYDHVVVGVDFSPGSAALLQSLDALRNLGTTRLTLVHAIQVTYPVEPTGSEGGQASVARRAPEENLDREAERLRQSGFAVHTEAIVGFPPDVILSVAADRAASLILVGSRSHSRTMEAFVGSVSWSVVHDSTLPVLIQRITPAEEPGGEMRVAGSGGFDRIVFPTDWSHTAERAFNEVVAIAKTGAVPSFLVIHVRDRVEEARTGVSTRDDDMKLLDEIVDELRAAGAAEARTADPGGAPYIEILRAADDDGRSLIVMGTHGRGLVAEALIGSVSREVLRHARGPVLLVPRQR